MRVRDWGELGWGDGMGRGEMRIWDGVVLAVGGGGRRENVFGTRRF